MVDVDRHGPDVRAGDAARDDERRRRRTPGLASGLFNTSQQIGGALGLAILSTLAAIADEPQDGGARATTRRSSSGYHARVPRRRDLDGCRDRVVARAADPPARRRADPAKRRPRQIDPGRRMTTLRADAERNRGRVLEAARAVFAEHGLEAGVAEIAERAGVGVATIFRRFPTKDDLLAAILEARVARSRSSRATRRPSVSSWSTPRPCTWPTAASATASTTRCSRAPSSSRGARRSGRSSPSSCGRAPARRRGAQGRDGRRPARHPPRRRPLGAARRLAALPRLRARRPPPAVRSRQPCTFSRSASTRTTRCGSRRSPVRSPRSQAPRSSSAR